MRSVLLRFENEMVGVGICTLEVAVAVFPKDMNERVWQCHTPLEEQTVVPDLVVGFGNGNKKIADVSLLIDLRTLYLAIPRLT